MRSSLRVMKFGGTSVGDAECMRRAAAIVQSAAAQGPVVVVVSAMSGVTNRLIDTAHRAEAGESAVIGKLIGELGDQHRAALRAMVPDSSAAIAIDKELHAVLAELDRLLQGTALLSELTPRVLDAISGMGERLSAHLLAGAIRELGLRSVVVASTEVIVTDDHHGRAEPLMGETRARCEAKMRQLIDDGVVPVVTGFIAAT